MQSLVPYGSRVVTRKPTSSSRSDRADQTRTVVDGLIRLKARFIGAHAVREDPRGGGRRAGLGYRLQQKRPAPAV